jgi:hypothetical protein
VKEYLEFRKKINGSDNEKFRANLKENYTLLEKYCKEKIGKKATVMLLSDRLDLHKNIDVVNAIKSIIELDYIKSNSLNFEVNLDVKNATDFLRQNLLGIETESKFAHNESKAILYLLQQIRDNITHNGKFELDEEQFERNYKLVKAGSEISDKIIEML